MTFSHTAVFDAMFDDAALFPPGDSPMDRAVAAYRHYSHGALARFTGPLVIPAARLGELSALCSGSADAGRVRVSLTFPEGPGGVARSLAAAARVPGLCVAAVEVGLPKEVSIEEVVVAMADDLPEDVVAFVEIPRDQRCNTVIAALAESDVRGKFRTGGVRAELYPGEAELAAAVGFAVRRGLVFKATAGLHHAVRNTDPGTGFEQHGFLNLIAAVDAADGGASDADLETILANRDETDLAAAVAEIPPARVVRVRSQFRSFGTCSVLDPLTDLVRFGLVDALVLPTDPPLQDER
ncbi:hypothetical protein [Nocardia jejuensis]|uniref:hypothetical protein n=1 Tax=Nocardia jejuensis TaxID=328049 RepID=UPI00082EAC6A|nr:hypothetical protein [Nocardia jejuensis]